MMQGSDNRTGQRIIAARTRPQIVPFPRTLDEEETDPQGFLRLELELLRCQALKSLQELHTLRHAQRSVSVRRVGVLEDLVERPIRIGQGR